MKITGPLKIILVLLLPFFALSQSENEDINNLHFELKNATTDELKMLALSGIASYYTESLRDSSMFYRQKSITYAEKLDQPLWKARFLLSKAYLLQKDVNLSSSLKLCNEALTIANDAKNEKNVFIPKDARVIGFPLKFRLQIISSAYHQLGNTYSGIGRNFGNTDDLEKAIDYYKKAKALSKENDSTYRSVTSNLNIGSIYTSMDQPDSAFMYSMRALKNARLTGYKTYEGSIGTNIGDHYFKKGVLDSAKYYYQTATKVNKEQNNVTSEIKSHLSLAKLYEKQKQPDSMLYFASAAMKLAYQLESASYISATTQTVALAYKELGNNELALNYLTISKKIGDSLQSDRNKKLLQFQNQNFDEQIRLEKEAQESVIAKNRIRTIALFIGLGLLSLLALVIYRNNRKKNKSNKILETTLTNLKATQTQLIQSEKMASLGELTAGIAHEIQNPLNFVNNFAEVNMELLQEMEEEIEKGNFDEVKELAKDVASNEDKIMFHGKRADSIVKGMLQHSRNSNDKKEPTNINALTDEYLRLAYHGLRAKDKSFNATMHTDFDDTIGTINIIGQDIGRVVLNLITNAFYVVDEKKKSGIIDYEPTVSVSTKKRGSTTEIRITDNGNGIPKDIINRIFEPFFTTKPTGQGTGLGLSMSYDIVTKSHGGDLKVETKKGEGTTFIITLPITDLK